MSEDFDPSAGPKANYAMRRAAEAEALASRLPDDKRREMLQQIAYLWREVAQHALLDDMRSRKP